MLEERFTSLEVPIYPWSLGRPTIDAVWYQPLCLWLGSSVPFLLVCGDYTYGMLLAERFLLQNLP
jgi:hypothetical protein